MGEYLKNSLRVCNTKVVTDIAISTFQNNKKKNMEKYLLFLVCLSVTKGFNLISKVNKVSGNYCNFSIGIQTGFEFESEILTAHSFGKAMSYS